MIGWSGPARSIVYPLMIMVMIRLSLVVKRGKIVGAALGPLANDFLR